MAGVGWQVVGDVTLDITDDFQLAGIALGTIIVIVYFHLVRILRSRVGVVGSDESTVRRS